MTADLASLQRYNALCWRMSLVIYKSLMFRCGVRYYPIQPKENLL